MQPPSWTFLLGLFVFRASCGYVQTQLCEGTEDDSLLSWCSLFAELQQNNILSLEVRQQNLNVPCNDTAIDFSATLDQDMLGLRSQYLETGSTECHTWNAPTAHPPSYLAYPMTFDLGSLPPLSTFDIRLQLETPGGRDLGCLQAVITPALSTATSATLRWVPASFFVFVLLVGILRGFNERIYGLADASRTSSDLNLPGVGEFLNYLQFMFLSGSLSLQYPGFFQPVVSKLHLFSLFTRGPITHAYMYRSVENGIYAINGTYGGTTGLEHMHQIVGAPQTMTTWYNFVIAFLIITAAAALFVEFVTACRKRFESKYRPVDYEPTSSRLSSRVIAVLRLILSYFTLPLSALSFYQLSMAAWLPIYHTVSASLLIIASILAFIWLFRRLPAQSAGRLIHGVPKWYQKELAQSTPYGNYEADKFFATTVVVLTFVRGAVIGGLQLYGPVQLAMLGASELGLLVAIRWLRAYSSCTVGTIAPICRLLVLLLMVSFAHGLARGPVKSAFGYAILALHASMLVFGFFLPTVYHFSKICRNVALHFTGKSHPTRSFEGNVDMEQSLSSVALAPMKRRNSHIPAPILLNGRVAPMIPEPASNPSSPAYGYFREPRHSSMRSTSGETKAASILSAPSYISTAYEPEAVSPPSSSHSGSADDSWHDTRSLPLGPRWNDYTYREGDAFYGAPSNAKSKHIATPMSSSPMMKAQRNLNVVSDAFSSIKQTIISTLSPEAPKPQESGFQVIRPPRHSAQLVDGLAPGEPRAHDEESISSE